MATKKEENKAAATVERKFKVKLPKLRGKSDAEQDVFYSVNGKNYLIRRGEEVEVPESLYQVMIHEQQMVDIADDYESGAARG